MARIHYWQYIVDEEGRPINNVDVDFFLNEDTDSTQYADIYVNPTVGHMTTTDAIDLKTNVDGYFEFWVGDEWELEGGYTSTQKFKLTWYKPGISRGTIENIDIYPPLYQIDETLAGQTPVSEAERRNKVISNELAYRWENHVNSMVPSASPHNIQPVIVCSPDTEYNKVVSNELMNKIFTLAVSASTTSLDASAADVDFSTVGPSGGGFDHPLIPSAGTLYYANVTHNLNTPIGNEYPIVQVVDRTDNTLIIPETVYSINAEKVRIFLEVPVLSAGTFVVTAIG
jgi:hypothetical protein